MHACWPGAEQSHLLKNVLVVDVDVGPLQMFPAKESCLLLVWSLTCVGGGRWHWARVQVFVEGEGLHRERPSALGRVLHLGGFLCWGGHVCSFSLEAQREL